MSKLAERLGNEMFEKHVESVVKDALEKGISAGDDENALTNRVFNSFLNPDSAVIRAAREHPVLRGLLSALPHMSLTAAAEFFSKHADQLLPGDNRPAVQAIRLTLKAAAPALMGTGEAGSDVLAKQIDKAVKGVVSSSATDPTRRKGMLDELVEMYLIMPGRFFVPARDAAGKIRLQKDETPVVNDHQWQSAYNSWQISGSRNPIAWRYVSLQDAVARMEYVNPRDVEAVRKIGVPATLSKDARRLREALSAHGDRQFAEDIFSDIKNVADMNQLGEDFASRVHVDAEGHAHISEKTYRTLHRMFDHWYGAELEWHNKILRSLKELAATGNIPAKAWVYLAGAGFSVFGVIALSLGSLVAGLTLSTLMFINGLTTPLTGTTTFFGHTFDNAAYAFYMSIGSGFLAFIITWTFPFVQAFGLGWISGKTGRNKEWLTSLGQKIAAYALLVPTVMIPLGIMAGLDPQHRLLILACSGVPIACGYILQQVRAFAVFEQMVIRTTPLIQLIFGAGLFAFAFVHGWYTSTPARTQTVNTSTVSAWSWLTDSMKGQIVLLCLVMVALVVFIHWREKPQNYGGQMVVHPLPARNWILAGIAAAGLYFIFFHEPAKMRPSDVNLVNDRVSHTDMTVQDGKSKVRVREDRYEDGTTRRSVSGKVVAPADTPKPGLTKSALCASKKLSEGARERYCNLN